MRRNGVWLGFAQLTALSLVVACSGGGTEKLDDSVTASDAQVAGPSVDAKVALPAAPRCGDGKVDVGEACDLGSANTNAPGTKCRMDCKLPRCGDNIVDDGEECDTGSNRSDFVSDACRTDCSRARCGDGVTDMGETCDTGKELTDSAADSCRTSCQRYSCGDGVLDTGESCDTGAARSDTVAGACRLDCQPARCGDGVVDEGESCDTGTATLNDNEPNACRTTCQRPSCGDGVVDTNEGCDTGSSNLNDSLKDSCRSKCTVPRCGDGVLDTGEACDDGDMVDSNGCRNDCSNPSCGDGKLDPGEECDDANRLNADGCQATCLKPLCGDGVVDPGELCDDDNTFENDGCRSNCQLGCKAAADCTDNEFCNGAEQCVNGLCQPGAALTVADMVACTVDSCDEAGDQILHTPSDMLCMASPNRCAGGALTQFTATCAANGCQQAQRSTPCPDAPSTCTPGANNSQTLTTFAPGCANPGACGGAVGTTRVCEAPAPSCDPTTRVGTLYRATCNAGDESCGSEVAARNNCAEVDATRCAADNTTFTRVRGTCSADGSCASTTTTDTCMTGATSCNAGRLTGFVPSCNPANGCGAPQASGTQTCPRAPSTCDTTANGLSFTSYAPSCNGQACSERGAPTTAACPSAAAQCRNGQRTTFTPSCTVTGGCGAAVASAPQACPAPAATCTATNNGFTFTSFVAGCADAQNCAPQGMANSVACNNSTACNAGVLTVDTATCDVATGCGGASATMACPAVAASCSEANGVATVIRAVAASCLNPTACNAAAGGEPEACPSRAAECATDNGVRGVASFTPACEGTGCGTRRSFAPCAVPPSVCVAGSGGAGIVSYTATCEGATCGSTPSAPVPCEVTAAPFCRDGKLVTPTAACNEGGSACGTPIEVVTDDVKCAPPPDAPPEVSIASPTPDSTFTVGDSIKLVGSASDVKDGNLNSSAVWTSDLATPPGATAETFVPLVASDCETTTHTATLTAIDSKQQVTSRSVTFNVLCAETPDPDPVPDPVPQPDAGLPPTQPTEPTDPIDLPPTLD